MARSANRLKLADIGETFCSSNAFDILSPQEQRPGYRCLHPDSSQSVRESIVMLNVLGQILKVLESTFDGFT